MDRSGNSRALVEEAIARYVGTANVADRRSCIRQPEKPSNREFRRP